VATPQPVNRDEPGLQTPPEVTALITALMTGGLGLGSSAAPESENLASTVAKSMSDADKKAAYELFSKFATAGRTAINKELPSSEDYAEFLQNKADYATSKGALDDAMKFKWLQKYYEVTGKKLVGL
jgi:hypothetical protein